jgi:hypothetical protein
MSFGFVIVMKVKSGGFRGVRAVESRCLEGKVSMFISQRSYLFVLDKLCSQEMLVVEVMQVEGAIEVVAAPLRRGSWLDHARP